MASKHKKKVIPRVEDLSLETTVPTDLSFSPDEVSEIHTTDDDRTLAGRNRFAAQNVHKHQGPIERRQLINELQALRIELSQKCLFLESIESDYQLKVKELEHKLNETLNQKQLLQTQLEAQIAVNSDEVCRRQEGIARELEKIVRRQQQLEATNERLQETAVDIRRGLKDFELTELQYNELRRVNEDDLALKDFIAMKLFENQTPWKVENEGLKSRCKQLSDELSRYRSSLEKCQDDFIAEKEAHSQLETRYQRVSLAFADVKNQVQHGDYKLENYDRVKTERDDFERQLGDLQKQHAYLDATHQAVVKERDELAVQSASSKQALSLMTKDKDFYAKQINQLETKLRYADDRIVQLNEQLERTKQAREDLFTEYVASRDKYRSDYEEKLRNELEQIRIRTDTEIDRLKSTTREMYERENRSLREARDHAISEKDRALSAEKDTHSKYEELLQDFRQQQLSNDSKITELHNDLKLKTFETERTQLVYEETCRTLKQEQLDNEKTHSKLEVLTKQYYAQQTSMEKRVSELETVLTEKTVRLESYEKLEHELDEVVMQAADAENDDDAERVLFSYGYGANMPTTAKRRLKQSVQLARRILNLERSNASLQKELEKEKISLKNLSEELKNANKLLDETHQPHQYLIESIRQRDGQIEKLKHKCEQLEADLRRSEKERGDLSKAKNQLALDLERLLSHKEEMAVMKQVVLNLSQPQYPLADRTTLPGPRATVRKIPGLKNQPAAPRPSVTFEQAEKDENAYNPKPTEFTANRRR